MIETFKEKTTLFVAFILLVILIIPTIALAQSDLAQQYMMQMAGVKELPKTAQTGTWHWEDVSENVGLRDGRAIWAVAKAGGYWYFTDGIAFNEHGRVIRTDGQSYEDVTLYVQQQGLERVDDIVSDGHAVMFLQDVVRRDSAFKAVSYDGVVYEDITADLRETVGEGQGIVSLVGKDGFWIALTNNGDIQMFGESSFDYFADKTEEEENVFMFDLAMLLLGIEEGNLTIDDVREASGSYAPGVVELAEKLLSMNQTTMHSGEMKYSMRHVAPDDGYDYLPMSVAMMDDSFLIGFRDAYKSEHAGETSFFMFGKGQFYEDVTNSIGEVKYLHAMAANHDSVLIAGSDSEEYPTVTDRVYLFDGNQTIDLSQKAKALPFQDWNRVKIASNGNSWMILNGKHLVRFDGQNFEDLGETRDYFINVSGAPNGMFYLGGLVSSKDMAEPMSPWRAKLVMVNEEGYVAPQTPQPAVEEPIPAMQPEENLATELYSDIRTLSLKTTILKKNQSQMVAVQSGAPDGLKSVEIFANDKVVKICGFEGQKTEQECAYDFKADRYDDRSFVKISAVATDIHDQKVNSESAYMAIFDSAGFGENHYILGSGLSGLSKLGEIAIDESASYKVDATIDDGLKMIEILINGTVAKTCNFSGVTTGVCEVEVSGFAALGGDVNIISRFVNDNDQEIWSGARVLEVVR